MSGLTWLNVKEAVQNFRPLAALELSNSYNRVGSELVS